MDVGPDQIFVGQVHARWCDGAGDHALRAIEEVLVVRAAGCAVGKDERGLSAPAGAPAALRVVGRRRRNVAQVDDVQLGDVDAQLHRRRAEQDRQVAGAESLFAVEPVLVRDLGRVFAGLETQQLGCDGPVELDEVGVGPTTGIRQAGDGDRVVKRLGSVARDPDHRRGRNLVAGDLVRRRRPVDDLDQAGDAKRFQQVAR